MTDQDAVIDGVAAIERDMGPIDILINNAGIQRRAPLEEFSRKDWDDLMSTNVNAVFFVGQAVARHMIPADGARSSISVPSRVNSPVRELRPIRRPRERSKPDKRYGDGLGQARTSDQRAGTGVFCDGNDRKARGGRRIHGLAVQTDAGRTVGAG